MPSLVILSHENPQTGSQKVSGNTPPGLVFGSAQRVHNVDPADPILTIVPAPPVLIVGHAPLVLTVHRFIEIRTLAYGDRDYSKKVATIASIPLVKPNKFLLLH